MKKGIVKNFNDKNGFGTIIDTQTNEEYFVFFTAIMSPGYRTLEEGQNVTFQLAQGKKTLQAINVEIAEEG